MSRFKKFAHSLASGYVLLGANILYTLASVPLALHYLSKSEFGLWALVTQMAGYIALVDFGMSGAVSRILIDYKDRRADGGGEYGSLIQTGALVGAVQGALILIIGAILASVVGPLLEIPKELGHDFVWLMIGQCALLGASFATRIFSHLLAAHQRYDVSNYASALNFLVSYGVMWLCFARGMGVFSILWSQASGVVLVIAASWLGCVRLSLFPSRGGWGRPTWFRFRELFVFGRDMFLFSLGSQLVNASQAILLTRLVGLEATAVWSVCSRTYALLLQVIYRIFDYSTPVLAEMIVRGENERLFHRFRGIVVLSASLSLVAGALFAVCNAPFVSLWTAGKVSWSPVNDWLLAAWLVVCASVHAHTGLVGQAKAFRFLRYIYFIEGATFITLAIVLVRWWGVTGMLAASLVCSLVFTFPYGLWRTKEYFNLRWSELAHWHRELPWLALWLLPVTLGVAWSTKGLPLPTQLLVNAGLMGLFGIWAFVRHGMGESLRAEVAERAPAWIRPILVRFGFPR